MIGERLPGMLVLAFVMSEELDRLNVGVAVDDAARDRRSHVRQLFRSTPNPGNEKSHRSDITPDPKRQGTSEAPIGPCEDDERAYREDGHEPERVDDLHHRFPQRSSGLNNVGGDAAGEVVGEIRDRLAKDIAVGLPADEIGHARRDRLLDHQIVGEARQRTADKDQERNGQKLPAMSLKQVVRVCLAEDVDEGADGAKDGDFDERDDEADRQHGGEKGPDLTTEPPIIADETRGRHARVVFAKRIDRGFKEA